jgi:hypothetical protein
MVPVALGIATRGIQVTAPGPILLAFVVFLLGGFMEEAIFRGVILRALLPGGLLRANLLAATIFATAHLAGLAVGADPAAAALQWVYTWLFGFAAVAALTYARNLWPLVIIHSLVNFGSYLMSGDYFNTARPTVGDAIGVVILMAVPAAAGWWLLRRASRRGDEGSGLPGAAPMQAARAARGGPARCRPELRPAATLARALPGFDGRDRWSGRPELDQHRAETRPQHLQTTPEYSLR